MRFNFHAVGFVGKACCTDQATLDFAFLWFRKKICSAQ